MSGRAPASILFICNRNSVRSPMAHALAQAAAGAGAEIVSVGLEPGELDPFSVATMAEIGLDISGYRPTALAEIGGRRFDLVVALTAEARTHAEAALAPGGRLLFWPTDDPTPVEGNRDQRLAAWRTVRDALARRIGAELGGG